MYYISHKTYFPWLFTYEYLPRINHGIADDFSEQISLSGREISKPMIISLDLRREWGWKTIDKKLSKELEVGKDQQNHNK